MLPIDRLLALLGVLVFLGAAAFLNRHLEGPSSRAATFAVIAGFFAARLAYVATHWSSFRDDPMTIAAVWQGGFSSWPGIAAAALTLVVVLGRSSRLWRMIAALAIAAILWAGAGTLLRQHERRPMPRGIMVYAPDGTAVSLDSYRGRPFVINLWASWCGPCRREMPMLQRAARARPAVPVLFVDQGEDAAKVMDFLKREGLAPVHVLLDPSQDAGRAMGSGAFPTTLFLGADGTIRVEHPGEISRAAFDEGVATIVENGR